MKHVLVPEWWQQFPVVKKTISKVDIRSDFYQKSMQLVHITPTLPMWLVYILHIVLASVANAESISHETYWTFGYIFMFRHIHLLTPTMSGFYLQAYVQTCGFERQIHVFVFISERYWDTWLFFSLICCCWSAPVATHQDAKILTTNKLSMGNDIFDQHWFQI